MSKEKSFIKGQSLLEIVTIFAIVALVVVAMEVYIKRGIQGKTKELTDKIIGSQQRAYTSDWQQSTDTSNFSGTTSVSTVEGGGVYKNIDETTSSISSSESKGKI